MDEIVQFDFPTDSPKIIKVIGVGGGGGNAVNHMYREGIHDVTFVLCNTDNQALAESPVPVKLQLGRSITQGLGAGNRPERARDAAEESIEDIRNQLNDGTKMVFITAGMGGGTGTGAAPVIARIAKEMDILTVGIVTIPFIFEGEKKIIQALDGVERIAQHVDALLVINNERLREIYADLTFMNAFGKADDTLSIAAKSIAEIITMRGTVNLDFADVKTILKDGGVAIMSTGFGEGENRVTKAIDDALHSPLLNNNDIFNAKKVMLNVSFCPSSELMMEEMNEIHEFMSKFREGVEVIWGVAIDNSLETRVKITVLATGFGVEDVPGMDSLHAARSQEEEERQLQLEEEKEKNKERIRKAYGESASNIGSKSLRKRRHIYLFNTEDLDNDDIIAMVEDSPTYMRDKTTLTKIRTKAALEEEVATEEALKLAHRIAKERQCQLIDITNKQISPNEFLGYFKYATFAVVVSFHGTVFSLMYKTNFYTYATGTTSDIRYYNLLDGLNMGDRCIKAMPQTIEDVDFSKLDKKMQQFTAFSKDYINDVIQQSPSDK